MTAEQLLPIITEWVMRYQDPSNYVLDQSTGTLDTFGVARFNLEDLAKTIAAAQHQFPVTPTLLVRHNAKTGKVTTTNAS